MRVVLSEKYQNVKNDDKSSYVSLQDELNVKHQYISMHECKGCKYENSSQRLIDLQNICTWKPFQSFCHCRCKYNNKLARFYQCEFMDNTLINLHFLLTTLIYIYISYKRNNIFFHKTVHNKRITSLDKTGKHY